MTNLPLPMTLPPDGVVRQSVQSSGPLVRGTVVVAASMIAGQVLGFARQTTMAYLLGTGPEAAAVAVAFALLDLCWAVLSTTAIFGLGPQFAQPAGVLAFGSLVRAACFISGAASAVLLVAANGAVRLVAPGLPADTAATAASLLRVTSLALPAISLSALCTALLYCRRRFAYAAFRQGVMNAGTVIAALLLGRRLGALGFAVGYTGGAWLQSWGAWLVARPLLASSHPVGGPQSRAGSLLPGPLALLGYSWSLGLVPLAARAQASVFGAGATAAFDYSLRILGGPLALLVTPLSASLLAEVASLRQAGDSSGARALIQKAAGWTLCAAAVVAITVVFAGPRLVAIAFQRGRFDANSTAVVTSMLPGLCPVLLVWSFMDVISRSLFSLGKVSAPLLAALLALTVTIACSMSFQPPSVQWIGAPATVGLLVGAGTAAGCLLRPTSEGSRAG